MNDTDRLTFRSRQIMEALVANTDTWASVGEIAAATGIATGTVSPLLGRLIDLGYVEDNRVDGKRLFRILPDQLEAARYALRPRPTPPVNGHKPATAHTDIPEGEKVWTVRELEEAVTRGGMPASVLAAVRRELRTNR